MKCALKKDVLIQGKVDKDVFSNDDLDIDKYINAVADVDPVEGDDMGKYMGAEVHNTVRHMNNINKDKSNSA